MKFSLSFGVDCRTSAYRGTRAAWRVGVYRSPVIASQTIYVWIDALINYITGQGFGSSEAWRRVWNAETKKIHVIGKNVWKFHAVYWPALLLSAGLPLPDEIVVHGFLTVEGAKISKSLANVINPFACIDLYVEQRPCATLYSRSHPLGMATTPGAIFSNAIGPILPTASAIWQHESRLSAKRRN